MGKVKNREFWESATMNNRIFIYYYHRLVELAISMFEWYGEVPKSIDTRFLELGLFTDGYMLYFNDDVLGDLALRTTIGGGFNVYNIPIVRRAYASNGYQKVCNEENSVIIYNNLMHTNTLPTMEMFAQRLWQYDRTGDINVNAQKTPILLIAKNEAQRLALTNLYQKYEGNVPAIMGSKSLADLDVKTLQTNAPFVADRVYNLKINIWNEALEYLGIPSVANEKRERMIDREVEQSMGACMASRSSRLTARQMGAEQVGDMFGKNIKCRYRVEVENEAYALIKEAEQNFCKEGNVNE